MTLPAPYLADPDLVLYHGDALETLRSLPDGCVDMVATSPPFYGLRDYGTGSWEGGDPDCDHINPKAPSQRNDASSLAEYDRKVGHATGTVDERSARREAGLGGGTTYKAMCGKCGARRVDRQIGLEETPDEWVARLVAVFRECRRVLADHGTLWVEIGDSYCANQREPVGLLDAAGHVPNAWSQHRQQMTPMKHPTKPKDLLGQPWLLAQALRDPWYGGEIKDERDRVWLAATIDAEGCIAGNRHVRKDDGSIRTAIHCSITNTSKAMLDEAERIWPASRQNHMGRDGALGDRPCWRWVANNVDRGSMLMRELYPHLIVKKRQAMLAYNFYDMSRWSKRLGKTKQGEEMRGRRDWIVAALSDLNRGRDIDVPSWIKEPPTLYEGGWFLRSEIIWARLRPNPMPESVTDRPTKAHSTVFLLSKNPRYFFDQDAIREQFAGPVEPRYGRVGAYQNRAMNGEGDGTTPTRVLTVPGPQTETLDGSDGEAPRGPDGRRATRVQGQDNSEQHRDGERWPNPSGANARSVWNIATEPTPFAHFATWPRKLVARMIQAGTSERGKCPECGKPWVRETERGEVTSTGGSKTGARASNLATVSPKGQTPDNAYNTGEFVARERFTIGWSPSCECYDKTPDDVGPLYGTAAAAPCVVLDPFAGSGTTLLVARHHGRHAIGIELNESYCALVADRTRQQSLLAETA